MSAAAARPTHSRRREREASERTTGEKPAMDRARRRVVLKFGGTSVDGVERLGMVARIVRTAARRSSVAVVVSAMAGVTDALLRMLLLAEQGDGRWTALFADLERRHLDVMSRLAEPLERLQQWWTLRARLEDLHLALAEAAASEECAAPLRSRVLASGERCCVPLAVAALHNAGLAAVGVDAADLIATDSTFGDAEVDLDVTCEQVRRRLGRLRPDAVPVVPGFVGADRHGRTTVLGRGGSDWSAALLGAALGAERVEIWTDVPGVLSAPPRWVRDARTLPRLSVLEAATLARWGGRVLHARTLEPLARCGTPLAVANSFDADGPSTLIADREPSPALLAVTGRAGVIVSPDDTHPGAVAQALDPCDGRPIGVVCDAPSSTFLAMMAVIGNAGDWDGALRDAVQAARLPVLAAAPRLGEAAVGLVVRAYHLPRAVKALHDVLITAPAGGRWPARVGPIVGEVAW
jgi:aspartate kinase